MKDGIAVGCCMKMADSQAYNFIRPLLDSPLVNEVHLVRHNTGKLFGHPKVYFHPIPFSLKSATGLISIYRTCRYLSITGKVKAWITFNPFPYGQIVGLACRSENIPYHIGFVGTDWYKYFNNTLMLKFSLSLIKKAGLITATGSHMKKSIVKEFPESNVVILPHSIDILFFTPNDPTNAKYDLIFVGQHIKRKRPELAIHALHKLKQQGKILKLCMLGVGPLTEELMLLSKRLELFEQIEFPGHVEYGSEYLNHLKASRIIILPSDMEGLPYVIVEAACCGLVPITTPVGTISDFITNGDNGFLFSKGNVNEFANCINNLLDNPELYSAMREKNIAMRDRFAYRHATEIWNSWFKKSGLIEN